MRSEPPGEEELRSLTAASGEGNGSAHTAEIRRVRRRSAEQMEGSDGEVGQKMYISIGNPDVPTQGGAGLVYVDDIWSTKSEPVG